MRRFCFAIFLASFECGFQNFSLADSDQLGIIPVVIGTTNILEFSPAVGATIDASVYTSASVGDQLLLATKFHQILAEELKTLNENDGMFWARTAFKSNPGLIKAQFKQLLASFSVSPEADICDFLTSHGFKKNSREKYLHSDHTCQFPSILTRQTYINVVFN